MKAIANGLAILICVTLAGCAGRQMTASSDYDPNVDFSKFQTFSWIDPNPLVRVASQRPLSPLLVVPLQEQTAQILIKRGLTFVGDPAQADLVVAFTIGSREGIRITSYPTRSFQSRRPGHTWGGYWPSSTVSTRRYTEGQLAIDLFEVEQARPVWHGTTTRRVRTADREAPEDLIRKAVIAILEDFPPG